MHQTAHTVKHTKDKFVVLLVHHTPRYFTTCSVAKKLPGVIFCFLSLPLKLPPVHPPTLPSYLFLQANTDLAFFLNFDDCLQHMLTFSDIGLFCPLLGMFQLAQPNCKELRFIYLIVVTILHPGKRQREDAGKIPV